MNKIITTTVKKNNKYYKNILINTTNNKIISLGCIISSYISGNYRISISFYKIYSFKNDICLDNINQIIKKKFPYDITNKILTSYLRNDVSFKSIKEDTHNTLKLTANINYCNNLYKIFISKSTLDNIFINENYSIFYKISKKFETLLNNKTSFNIDEIFNINDDKIDECIVYNINSTSCGWGINI